MVAEVFGGQDGAGWTIKFWYDAHRAYGVIGYALFFVIFALIFEKFMFDQLSNDSSGGGRQVDGVDVVEQQFDAPDARRPSAPPRPDRRRNRRSDWAASRW